MDDFEKIWSDLSYYNNITKQRENEIGQYLHAQAECSH